MRSYDVSQGKTYELKNNFSWKTNFVKNSIVVINLEKHKVILIIIMLLRK